MRDDSTVQPAAMATTWPRWRTRIISLAILFHLTAVVLSPLSNPPPSSQLAQRLASVVRPYLQALFLEHGYRFFAPEPGPGHLVRYEITAADGSTISGRFPDRERIWPRLLYHRWFMLSETLFNESSNLPSETQEQQWRAEFHSQIDGYENEGRHRRAQIRRADFEQELISLQTARDQQNRLAQSIAQWLQRRYGGTEVKLTLVERLIPPMEDVIDGVPLDDDRYLPRDLWIPLPSWGSRR